MAEAMADQSAWPVSVPHRVGALVPQHDGLLAAMPGYTPSVATLASKLVTLFPANAGTALPTHQAVIAVFDPENGLLMAFSTAPRSRRSAPGPLALATRLLPAARMPRCSRSSAPGSRPALWMPAR